MLDDKPGIEVGDLLYDSCDVTVVDAILNTCVLMISIGSTWLGCLFQLTACATSMT